MLQNADTPNGVRRKKPFPLRRLAIIAGLCTVVGYVLVLIPLPPEYQFVEYFVFLGLLLSFLGMGMLIAALVVYSRRSQGYGRNWSSMYTAIRGGYKVIILGIITLVVEGIVQVIVWPVPSELSFQANPSLMQNLGPAIIGGLFWGFIISFYFVGYSHKIPLATPIHRALIISFLTVFVVNGLITLFHLNDPVSYYLWAVAYSIPRYFILGIVLGYSYKKFNSEQIMQTLQGRPVIIANRVI